MAKCASRTGIFIQRECDTPAYHQCADCKAFVCRNHLHPDDDQGITVLCHGCYLNKHELNEEEVRQRYLRSDKNFSLWYSSFRLEHADPNASLFFDKQDYQNFEQTQQQDQAYLDEEDGFFDS